ncbi:putative quinol monooxygenase [Pseudomonas sp. R5(2019)]|uniref:putative quinol monooxygenase n=1 Tax=Pseudomonas sp. R5(2019) TaxID=2697566 RepID=UPI00141278AA|nr:antibiotic biosynthesis monooxygenase [Pseudomonas sp. R5(2019)]NBA94735.1 antibiotic biosynthesis monooxygenase [Pseudomonas sp. R5(2019)]
MSQPSAVSHLALVRASAGSSVALGERLHGLIEPSRKAPGCLHFALQRSQCDADLWMISGFWASEPAMTAYFASPAMQVFSELVQHLMVNSLDLHTFSEVSARMPAVE